MSFEDRAVIITGGGGGLGREYALAFARAGASVMVNDLGSHVTGEGSSATAAQVVVDEIRALGGNAVANSASVATRDGARSIVDATLEAFGRVDALVNNAGIYRSRPFSEATIEGLMQHLEVHVGGTFLMCKAVWEPMVASGYGRIVNTVSGGMFGLINLTEYATAKGAIFGLTRSLALEASPHGIAVNAVAPQGATRMTSRPNPDPTAQEAPNTILAPALVTPTVLYLAGDQCAINGETLAAAGSHVARIGLSENEGITVRELTPDVIASRLADVLDEDSSRNWPSAATNYLARAEAQVAMAPDEDSARQWRAVAEKFAARVAAERKQRVDR